MMLQNRLTNHLSYLLILLLFLSQIQHSLSDRFIVIATKTPISATIGSDVILSFHLSPEINAENMEIGISRSSSTEFVFLYRRGQEVTGSQIEEYKGRTKLVTEHLKMGEISLLIRDVGPFDNGIYYCFVQSDNYYNENSLELILTMLGTGPVIRITDNDKGITAVCESNGWYPKPTVLWKDNLGKPLDNSNELSTEDESRLLSVHSFINVNPNNPTFCNFRSVLLNIQNQPGIRISDTLYNRVDRCFTSLIFIYAVLLLFILPIMYGLHKVRTLKAKLKETDIKLETDEELYLIKKNLTASKANILLDPETAHHKILVSKENKHAQCTYRQTMTKTPASTKRFEKNLFILSNETFGKGSLCYLDFKVNNPLCGIGICRNSIQRNTRINIHENKFICIVHISQAENFDFIVSEKESGQLRIYLNYDSQTITVVHVSQVESVSKSFEHGHEEVLFLLEIQENEVTLL
ncbi:butyrophilin subfamily 2 member A1-like [Pelobates fuscus]|uniref:butyrophilin subfamily 2 member A1-like n=1 Tax=Pelobates fuscus TaxID=191477 RepID=UPI002FE4AFB5